MPVLPLRLPSPRLLACLVLCAGSAAAVPPPLTVSSLASTAPRDIAKVVTGCDVTVYEARIIGAKGAFGAFSGGAGIVGFDSGLIISSGAAASARGPNTSNSQGTSNGTAGYDQLTVMSGQKTFDAAVLEFDFVPSATQVTFDYAFGSDEYNEFVNTIYNDVFAFWLNDLNVAVVPGTTFFVTINSINNGNPVGSGGTNAQYYIDNARGSATVADPVGSATRYWGTELDGLTVVFTVTATVVPGVINRIRFAIADGGDSVYDSVVFIRASSLTAGGPCPGTVVTPTTPLPAPAIPFSAAPNPFRPASAAGFGATSLTLRGMTAGSAIRIHQPGGRLVAELADADGDATVVWDARDRDGEPVASGVYLIIATAPDGSIRRTRVAVVR